MSRMLYRLGRSSAAHPWRILLAWLVAALAVLTLAGAVGGETRDDYDVPDARAQVGVDQLREHFPEAGYASAQVVVHDRDGGVLAEPALVALDQRLSECAQHAHAHAREDTAGESGPVGLLGQRRVRLLAGLGSGS